MTITKRPVRLAILGAGGRGAEAYGAWFLDHPEVCQIVAVAESVEHRRTAFAERVGLPEESAFADWRDLFDAHERLKLDAVVVALPDHAHVDPTLRAVELDLAVLLEKPVAPNLPELRRLVAGLEAHQPRIAVAHVLRETPFWRAVREIVDAGTLGDLATIRIEENIGFWHFAHSYVRGNWRRTEESSPMSLAKTCHDFDLIRWLADAPPTQLSSAGSLMHFRADRAPEGAPSHCIHGCPVASSCPFHAPRYYIDALADVNGWPVGLLGEDTSVGGRRQALAEGPYGRCVYRCDNDVADHQQTVLQFETGLTATLTASAFTGNNTRTCQLTGTRGELRGRMDEGSLAVELFAPEPGALPAALSGARRRANGPLGHHLLEVTVRAEEDNAGDHRGHAGGDAGLSQRFVQATSSADFDAVINTSFQASLDSHWMALAAEESRRTGATVDWARIG